MTRADALKEYKDCLAQIALVQSRYVSTNRLPYGSIGRESALDDYISDAAAYSERIARLEAILAAEGEPA